MEVSHNFDLESTPAFLALKQLIAHRFAEASEKAAQEQPNFERNLLSALLAVGAEIAGADLDRLDVQVDGLLVDDEAYRPKQRVSTEYTTLLGTVRVARTVYESRGGHGEKRCIPLEMRLGIVDGHWTPAAAEVGCLFMAATTSREAVDLLGRVSALRPSSCHLDRLPKHVSAIWEKDRQTFEEEVRAQEKLPEIDDIAVILVSLDGVMVPMKDAPRSGVKSQGPQGHREVGCSTICLFNAAGERVHSLQLARMPESRKVTLKEQLKAELRRLEALYLTAKFVAVADGARENWRILKELNEELGLEMEFVLDFYHAVEHIARAVEAIHGGETRKKAEVFASLRKVLLEETDGVGQVIQALKPAVKSLRGKKKADLSREIRYLEKHAPMMGYADLKQRGRPIGSGLQEAACKTVVAQRMKRSGMTWREAGGQAILTLRSLHQSARLDIAWSILSSRLRQPYAIDPNPARKRPLRMAA